MDASIALNVSAFVVSLLALCVSSRIAINQIRLQNKANHLPALLAILNVMRDSVFLDDYAYIQDSLRVEFKPDQGLSDLPREVRARIHRVCYFLQVIAYLSFLDIVDERLTLGLFGSRAHKTWDAIKPYALIDRERGLPEGTFETLEIFSERAAARPKFHHQQLLMRWRNRAL